MTCKLIARCEICSKLTIKTPERRHDVVPVSLLLTLTIFQSFSGWDDLHVHGQTKHYEFRT